MKKRQRLKKVRSIKNIRAKSYRKLYLQVEKQVKLVNERLESLERRHATGTWASGKLLKRVRDNKTKGLLYKGKRIKLKPKMTKTNLTALQKATKQFLKSATSTNKGIEKVREETIDTLKGSLNLERADKLSDREVEDLYNMLSNKDFERFNIAKNKEEFIGASAMWNEIDYANQNGLDENTFIERLQNLRRQDFDIDERKAAERIYNDYVL